MNEKISNQIPLSQTIVDFWHLILDQDLKLIVQLEVAQVSQKNKSYTILNKIAAGYLN